jgi:hypothetical protein
VVLLGPPGVGKTHCETHIKCSNHECWLAPGDVLLEADLNPTP